MDADLFYAWVVLLICAAPYFLFCRVLWHLGSWLKRKDK